jgi:hypothetical protein
LSVLVTSLNKDKDTSIWDAIDMATFKDGFAGGALFAIAIQLGIVNILSPFDRVLVFVLLILGIGTTVNKLFSRGSLISPPWDGVVSGFGVILGILNIIETYVIPYLTKP